MFLKSLAVRSIALRNVGLVSRTYHDAHHKASTMDDLPMPQGDWQEQYTRNQSKYNAVFVTGIVMFATAIGLVKSTGIMNLNYSPPQSIE